MKATRVRPCVLVASDLRSYRETIARGFRNLRPNIEVHEAESEELNREVARLQSNFVVCSRVNTFMVESRVPVWV